MEFLDISLTKLECFAPCYSQSFLQEDFQENPTLLWISKCLQKICETRKVDSIHE
jgi:hypothetical protein